MIEANLFSAGSRWKGLVARRYPRMECLGGDSSSESECWIAMSKCPHDQIDRWRYFLFTTKEEAEAAISAWNRSHCGRKCLGAKNHRCWRIHG